jgi:hypothetical protein
MITGMVKGLLGDPKVQRQKQIEKNLNARMEGFSHGMTFGHSRATQAIKGVIGQG